MASGAEHGARSRPRPSCAARTRRASSGMSSTRSRNGGSAEADDGEPEQQVVAEAAPAATASASGRLVAAITRTSTARGVVLAHAPHFALLQHAQQLGLRARRQLADLVEKQRAAVRVLEQARARRRPRR